MSNHTEVVYSKEISKTIHKINLLIQLSTAICKMITKQVLIYFLFYLRWQLVSTIGCCSLDCYIDGVIIKYQRKKMKMFYFIVLFR